MISVIVPVYNEEYVLSEEADYFRSLASSAELIFVDGGSSDRTNEIAGLYGKVLFSEKGRALQMNAGSAAASHDILLFMHADSKVALRDLTGLNAYIAGKDIVGGCFKQVYDASGILFKWIAWTGNFRAKALKVFYGDQGIFVKKDIFERSGRFPEVSIGEDVLFSKRIRHYGRTEVLPFTIVCSPRRWRKQGLFRTFFLNMRITAGLLAGVDPEGMAKAYKDIR